MTVLSENGIEVVRQFDQPLADFQVFGERSSGTNIVRTTLSNNLSLRHRVFAGWKHGFPNAVGIAPASLVVCVFRDPVDWITSLYMKPFHTRAEMRGLPFGEFLRHEWQSHIDRPRYLGVKKIPDIKYGVLQQDRHPLTGAPFRNACELRSVKAQALLGFRNRGVNYCFLKLETFLVDKAGALEAIARTFDLPFPGEVIDSDGDMGRGAFQETERPRPSQEDLSFMLAELDAGVESDLGYLDRLRARAAGRGDTERLQKISSSDPLQPPASGCI